MSVVIAAIIWDHYYGSCMWDHSEAGQGEARWETRKQGEGVCMAHQCSLQGVSAYLPKSQPDKAFLSSGACFPPPSSFPSVYSYGMLAVCQGLYEVWGYTEMSQSLISNLGIICNAIQYAEEVLVVTGWWG